MTPHNPKKIDELDIIGHKADMLMHNFEIYQKSKETPMTDHKEFEMKAEDRIHIECRGRFVRGDCLQCDLIAQALKDARNEALDECASLAEHIHENLIWGISTIPTPLDIANAIKALKDGDNVRKRT